MNAAACFIGTTFCVIAAFAARPYALGILMSQFDGDTGSVSSVFNFTLVFLGCLGMIAGTLPWPTYIIGLGACCLFAGVGVNGHLEITRPPPGPWKNCLPRN